MARRDSPIAFGLPRINALSRLWTPLEIWLTVLQSSDTHPKRDRYVTSSTTSDPPVALLTGAGTKRVGWHVAQALGERGYRLAIHYNRSASEAHDTVSDFTARGIEAQAFQAELSSETAATGLVAEVHDRFGRIDVLVNTAAIWNARPLEQTTAEDVRRHFEVNTLGTFLLCQHVGLLMTRQDAGVSIVNFGDWAVERPYPNYAAYFPSKGAIPVLTRTMAVELGRRNPRVRVNAILPGPVMLPADLSSEERAEAIRGTLVQREGEPRHVVLAVLHFIDNDFITGACLNVDGGRSIHADGL